MGNLIKCLIVLFCIFSPALSLGQNCSLFSETFDNSGRSWVSNSGPSWYINTELTGTSAGNAYTYAETAFPAISNFVIDTNVSVFGTGSYGIYLFSSGNVIHMADGRSLDGFEFWVNGAGSASLYAWDVISGWVNYGSASVGSPVGSIGLKFTAGAVYGRINGSDVIGPIAAPLSSYSPDTLWLAVQGDLSVSFDNICAGPAAGSSDLFAPHNFRYAWNGDYITLAWDPSAKATGYKIGLGLQPGVYDNIYDVSNKEQVGPINTVPYPPATYYVAVKAYNQSGESPYSSELAIKKASGGLAISPTGIPGAATGSFTLTSGAQVSFSATPNTADGSATASMSLGQDVISVRTDSSMAAITWKGVTVDGFGFLTPAEEQALNDLRQSGLAQALAMIPLDASCSGIDFDLAAAQALLLPWQLILKYTSCDPAAEARALADKSACSYFGNIDTAKAPGVVLLSEHDPIPYVSGSAPLDEVGAAADNPSKCPGPLVLGYDAFDDQTLTKEICAIKESYKTPCGSKCRAACGADCEKRNCGEPTLLYDCDDANVFLVEYEKYTCHVHQGCVDHDNCYDKCDTDYACANSWGNWGCHRKCDGACLGEYCKKCAVYGALGGFWHGAGCLTLACDCTKWAVGYGPPDRPDMDFIYVKTPNYAPCTTNQCNETTQTGGDAPPDVNIVNLGKTSGTFTFSYNTHTVKDRIVVTYGGNVLFDTGCVGASGSLDLNYSGTSSTVAVKVIPDCAGETGTAWEYTVGCAR